MADAHDRKLLFNLCETFVRDNEITCPEAIYQMDHVISNAHEFIEEVCNIVGYASHRDHGDEDEED